MTGFLNYIYFYTVQATVVPELGTHATHTPLSLVYERIFIYKKQNKKTLPVTYFTKKQHLRAKADMNGTSEICKEEATLQTHCFQKQERR